MRGWLPIAILSQNHGFFVVFQSVQQIFIGSLYQGQLGLKLMGGFSLKDLVRS